MAATFGLRQALQERVVGACRRPVGERGHVPGAADDGDPLEAVPSRRRGSPAHVRPRGCSVVGSVVGQLPSRTAVIASRIASNRPAPSRAMLDEPLPPALAVGVAGGSASCRAGRSGRLSGGSVGRSAAFRLGSLARIASASSASSPADGELVPTAGR